LLEDRHLLAAGIAFEGPEHVETVVSPSLVASADLNGDHLLDLIVADGSNFVTILLVRSGRGFGD
jgi:hypothetical protein